MTLKEKLTPSRIPKTIPPAKIKKDLERYRKMALELGADTAVVIPAKSIPIDERVRAKCQIPKCPHYGGNSNCPPLAPTVDFMRKVIRRYRYGVLFAVKGPTADFVGKSKKVGLKDNPSRLRLFEICTELESTAFYDGYRLALALGQGPCKTLWCLDQPCAAIQPGGSCRFPLKTRLSMESVGIDVFKVVADQGWEIFPCGARVDETKVPHILLTGLVLID
jgi:predicted metal-binding protein